LSIGSVETNMGTQMNRKVGRSCRPDERTDFIALKLWAFHRSPAGASHAGKVMANEEADRIDQMVGEFPDLTGFSECARLVFIARLAEQMGMSIGSDGATLNLGW
jgi:hypothetical protein